MVRERRGRVLGDSVGGRTGVTWRSPNHVVEVRIPTKVAVGELKLHFGSYKRENEAKVARDYAAYVRNSTGKEDRAAVGGFCNPDAHPSIFEFEESLEVFESLGGSGSRARARCDEYKNLLERQTKEAWKNFCKAAREDIGIAIESFRSRDPQKFPLHGVPTAEPVGGEIHRTPPPSSPEVRVSPTPGPEVGVSMVEGSTSFSGAISLEAKITVCDSHFPLTAEEKLAITQAGKDGMNRKYRELFDKWLEELAPCPTEPESIPALE